MPPRRIPRANPAIARIRVVGPVAAALVLTACGSSSDAGPRDGVDAGEAGRDAIRAFATATEPGPACDQLSSGFRLFIGDGEFTRTACIAHFAEKFTAPWAGSEVTFGATTEDHGQQIVHVTVDGGDETEFYLIEQYDTVKINSIGIREGTGPSPPPEDVYES